MRIAPLGPSVELPMGPRKGCPGWRRRMRAAPVGPSVELSLGPRNAVLAAGDACELGNGVPR
eukprot:5786709-Pyramimonas_sp.AAC.1